METYIILIHEVQHSIGGKHGPEMERLDKYLYAILKERMGW